MKNLKVLFTVLCVACACLNTTDILAAISGTWTETAFSDIPNGATIIIASNTDKALPSGATTASPTQVAITITGTAGNLTIVPTDKTLDDLVWTIDNSTSSAVKFITYGTTNCYLQLSSTSSNTALRVATTNSNNTFTMGSNGKLLKLSTANRYVGIYSSGSDWRTYNSESATNYGSTSLKFYVLNSGSSGSTETTVSYSANTDDSYTGTLPTDANTYANGDNITISNTQLTRTGYTHIGWNTDKNATEALNSLTATGSAITLYAIWKVNTYTITWKVSSKNYTEGTPSTSVEHGKSVSKLPTEPSVPSGCSGKVFVGWTDEPIYTGTDTKPDPLFKTAAEAPEVTENKTYHAVFADENGE